MARNTSTFGQVPDGSPPVNSDIFVIQRSDGLNYRFTAAEFSTFIGSVSGITSINADITTAQIIAAGTGLGLVDAGATHTFSIDATVATLTGIQTLTNKTLTTPTIASFVNASHTHLNAVSGGQITEASISDLQAYWLDVTTNTGTNKTFNSFTNDISADEVHVEARNESGVTINKGDAVFVSGYSVGQNLPLVQLADSSGAGTMPAFGIVESASVANNANGDILISGRITGFDTSSFTAGDVLYISNTGTTGNTLTNVKPTGTDLIEAIGEVLRSHATLGTVEVETSGVANDLPNVAVHDLSMGGLNLTNAVIVTPTIASFVNATHDHSDAAGGGTLLSTTALSDTANIAYLNTTNIYTAGTRQDFLGLLAGTAGLNVGGIAGNPTTQVNGDLWYNSTSNTMYGRVNGVNINLGAAGASAPPFADTISIVEGSADPTKELRFEVDGFTTATVRVITPPDADITLVNTSDGLIVDAQTGTFTTTKISTTNKALLNSAIVYNDQTNTFGDFAQIFADNQLFIQNPAATATFQISAPGIAANRTLTLPLLLGNDIFVTEAFAQTLTNKTMTAGANTFSGFAIGSEVTGASTDLTDTAVIARSTNNLSFFAATTSLQLLGVISDETGSGALVFGTSPTIVTPTIASFVNATHDHSDAAGGGNLTNSALTSGTFGSITGLGTLTVALVMGTNLITGIKGTQFVQKTLTYNATQVFDLDDNQYQQITLTGVLSTLSTSNRGAGKMKSIIIVGDSSDRVLTFNTSWKTNPNDDTVTVLANTFGVLSLYCRGAAETDIFAVYAEFS